MDIDIFLNGLEKRVNKNSSNNPYKDERVLNNLRVYLNLLKERYYNEVMLIAEAPGYSGCNITGIPFTTVKIIDEKPHSIFNELGDELYKGRYFGDNSGAIIWDYLRIKRSFPFFGTLSLFIRIKNTIS